MLVVALGSNTTDVADNDVYQFGIAAIATPQTGSVPFTITITAQDTNGVPVSSFVGSVLLSAAGDSGPLSVSPPSTGPFTAGQWVGSVTITNVHANVVLTADDGASHTGNSNPFDLVPGPLSRFAWDPVASPQRQNQDFSVGKRTSTGRKWRKLSSPSMRR